jgi:hypothetical protein
MALQVQLKSLVKRQVGRIVYNVIASFRRTHEVTHL